MYSFLFKSLDITNIYTYTYNVITFYYPKFSYYGRNYWLD